MDKHRKLSRYRQKDYTQLVDFPVEIVGRNGQIRIYSFEDSIRLYQRRVSTASSRYPDEEVVRAEVAHCRARIRQLRMSFFERYASPTLRGALDLGLDVEEAAEIVGLLARYSHGIPAECALREIGWQGHARVYFVELPGALARLLYLHRFQGAGAEGILQEHQRLREALDVPGDGEDVEHLHASHTTADLGLILTGREPRPHDEALEELSALFGPWEPQPGPVQISAGLLRSGATAEALRILDSVLAEHPDDRNAALTASLAAAQAGDVSQAELYVRLALAYAPQDGVLLYQLGVVHFMRGQHEQAVEPLEQAVQRHPRLLPARLLAALLHLHLGRPAEARRLVSRTLPALAREHSPPLRLVRALVWRARWRKVFLAAAVLSLALSGAWAWAGLPLALVGFAVVCGCVTVLVLLLRRPAPLATAAEIMRRLPVPREILTGQIMGGVGLAPKGSPTA
jgi:hypothetical protein